jgi:uncharacterized membrane protein SpoIIM required for sporulation
LAAVDEFIVAHRGGWDELERLLKRAGQSPRRLQAEEIERLANLYRHVTSDLARARRDFPDDPAVSYLNDLAARAHPLLYRAPGSSGRRLATFFVDDVPRIFRAAAPFVLVAFLLFAVPAVLAWLVTINNPQAAEQVLPGRLTSAVRAGRLWVDIRSEDRSLAASTIMTNNIQVSILAFAGGILLGTLTAYVLVLNGVIFGALIGYTHVYGLAPDLLTFVSPHGYLELTVVFISGGAGLQLAWGFLQPGLLRRRDAVALAARRAVLLLAGTAPLLVVAGIVEGFISPSDLPRELKLIFGPLTAVALYAYLLRGLRLRRRRRLTAARAL